MAGRSPDLLPQYSDVLRNLHRALLVDEKLADQVWELWNAGLISDDLAALAWWIILAGDSARLLGLLPSIRRRIR